MSRLIEDPVMPDGLHQGKRLSRVPRDYLKRYANQYTQPGSDLAYNVALVRDYLAQSAAVNHRKRRKASARRNPS